MPNGRSPRRSPFTPEAAMLAIGSTTVVAIMVIGVAALLVEPRPARPVEVVVAIGR